MSITIAMIRFDVPIKLPRGWPSTLTVELHNGMFQIWEESGQTACGEHYKCTKQSNSWAFGNPLAEMPYLDDVFRVMATEAATNRGNPLGAVLAEAVEAIEAVITARDGSSVYFAESAGRVKIGWSTKVATRIAQLQTGSPAPIRLLGTTPGGRGLERRLHEQFADARVGGEWFELTPELQTRIEALSAPTSGT